MNLREVKIGHETVTFPRDSSLLETVWTTGGSIELEETGAAAEPKHVKLSSDDIFDVVSTVAEEHFQTVAINPNTRVIKERLVRVLDQGVTKDMKIKIRKFSS